MSKAKSKNNGIKTTTFFYNLFLKRKRVFPTSYFLFPTRTRKKELTVPKSLWLTIIQTYLKIYFNEFYFNDTPKYFPLSGLLMKVKGAGLFINKKKGTFRESRSLTWIWYDRPNIAYSSNVRLLKMAGGTSRVRKLDNNYRIDNDIELLTPCSVALDELRTTNKFFRND